MISSTKKDIVPISYINPEILIKHHKLGFKLVPLSENHVPVEPWTSIYDNPNHWNVEDFKDPKLYSKFKNVATTLGKTHIKDSENNHFYIRTLDIDSEYAFSLINTPIKLLTVYDKIKSKLQDFFVDCQGLTETDLSESTLLEIFCKCTFVTKTKKPYGYHIWWLSHNQNKAIRKKDCKIDKDFEILTDKQGLATLPPSTYRDDHDFIYYNVGIIDKLLVSDILYNLLGELFNDCLIRNIDETNIRGENTNNSKLESKQSQNIVFHELLPQTIQTSIDKLLPYYKEGDRQNFSLHFSGYAYHCKISKETASKIILGICEQRNDKDTKERLATLHATYEKASKEEPITGGPTLADLMSKTKVCSVYEAQRILDDIKNLWYKEIIRNDNDDCKNAKHDDYQDEDDDDLSKNTTILSVSQGKMFNHGRYKIRGKIMQCGGSFKMISTVNNVCSNPECDYEFQKRFSRPLISMIDRKIDSTCPKCSKSLVSTTFDYINAVELELQDVDNVNDIDRLLVYLFEENIKSLKIGETVVIEGNIAVINKNDNKRKKLIAALFGNSISYENDEKIELTQKDIEKINCLKKEKETIDIEGVVKK
jgi:hypothetical protein